MDIKVSTYERSEENRSKWNRSLVGFAQITFDDSYVLDQIYIKQARNGDYYIELPGIDVRKKDENGNYVEKPGGNYEKEKLEVFHPITATARQELQAAVIHAFRDKRGEKDVLDTITGKFEPDAKYSRITPYEKDDQLAFGSVCFGDFVLERVQLVKKADGTGNKFQSPQRKVKVQDKDNPEEKVTALKAWFFPITSEAGKNMLDAIEKSYNNALQAKADSAQLSKENAQGASLDEELSLSAFEDVIDVAPKTNGIKR